MSELSESQKLEAEYQRGYSTGVNTIAALMTGIVRADVKPDVYDVTLKKSDHSTGFDAYIQFRTGEPGFANGLSAHDDYPDTVLLKLRDELIAAFGKCLHCGAYRHGVKAEGKE